MEELESPKELESTIQNKDNQSESTTKSESTNEEVRKAKYKYKCTFDNCNERFRREKDLDKHEFQHSSLKKYSCNYPDCLKKYRLRAHLKRHIQTYHEKKTKHEKIFECEIGTCNNQYSNKDSLRKHIRNFHNKVRAFPCPECDRVYQRKNHLKLHLVTHTKEFPYKCYKCEKGFVSEAIMRRHHTCSEHICDTCDEKFLKWSEFVKHRREKHQTTSFVCKVCEEVFQTKQKLEIHKKVHKEKHNCPWEGCTNSYTETRNLKNHINVVHLGRKYKCTIEGCDRELSSKSKLNYHLRIHERPKSTLNQIKEKKQRKKRKDSGIPKKSMVGVLANIILQPQVDKILKNNRDDVIIENASEHDTSETDGEERPLISTQLEVKVQES